MIEIAAWMIIFKASFINVPLEFLLEVLLPTLLLFGLSVMPSVLPPLLLLLESELSPLVLSAVSF